MKFCCEKYQDLVKFVSWNKGCIECGSPADWKYCAYCGDKK